MNYNNYINHNIYTIQIMNHISRYTKRIEFMYVINLIITF